MPQLLDSSLFSVIDTDSSIGVGWKLNFYIKGTSTRKDTYPTEADASAATNANSNPVVIASDGRLPAIWLADDADYKGILTDENDVVKETIVQINGPRLGGAAGAGNIGFSHAETYAAGTIGNHAKRFVVITDAPYNAVLGDTGNQTAAIQAAIDAVSASGGGDVVIPAGRFRCTGTITVPSNVSIWGSGPASAIHFVNTTGDGLFSAVGTELAPLSKIELRDFTIDGDITFSGGVPSADNGNAIDFQFTDDCRFSGLTISGFSSNGIAVANGSRNEVISCWVDQCAQSIAFYANAIDVEQNRVVSNKVTNNGEYNAIHFEGSAGTGLGDGNLYNSVVVGNVVSDTYGQGINIELAPNSTVTGNTVLRSGPGTSADLDNGIFVFGSALSSIIGNTVMNCDGYGIVIAAGSNECAVVGNSTSGNTQGSMLLTDSSGTAAANNVTVALNSFNEGDLARSGNVSTRNRTAGFKFSNVADSDTTTLDWYEEGSFTPVAQGSGTAGAGTYTTQLGRFTRIGNTVHFRISLAWSAHTGVGDLQVSGLPYAASATLAQPVTIWSNGLAVPAGQHFQASIPQSGSLISIQTYADTSGDAAAVAIDTVVAGLLLSGSYQVA